MNVLFIMVDEMAPWGCGPNVHTPNIDALRARGTDFTAAYTPSPICVPTRAAIATGKYVHEIGYWSSAEAYDGRVPSWGHQLADAGVRCESFGKLHYRSEADDTGFAVQHIPTHIVDGIGWVQALLRKPMCQYEATSDLAKDIGPGNSDYLDYDRRVARAAVDWITAPERKHQPWCSFVSFLCPHYPLIAPPNDYARYDDSPRAAEDVPDHPVLREMWEFWDHDRHFTPKSRGIAYASYQGLCTFVDRRVGQVLDALDASGQADDTLVIFTSDHGDMMGQHGFWVKSLMYENSARVPLILAGPGVATGERADPVTLIDIAPTVVEAFGLESGLYTGRSLRAVAEPDRTVISEYHDGGAPVGMTMVRWNTGDQAWKYVHYAEGYPPQLFELTQDPEEQNDLSSARPDVIAEGRRRMYEILDPEEVNTRALKDQAHKVDALGGRAVLEAMEQWNYTPADS
ncbi:MAG: sulfatase-like hydrolase/transferase [Pseudomonadota bacterium]